MGGWCDDDRYLVKKCCFILDLKIGVIFAFLWQISLYVMYVTFVQDRETVRFYVACIGLGIFVVLGLLYLGSAWICKKSMLLLPLVIFYPFSMAFVNTKVANDGKWKSWFWFSNAVNIVLDILVFLVDFYCLIILYSLYRKMKAEEEDDE